jgi:hypothetical protein
MTLPWTAHRHRFVRVRVGFLRDVKALLIVLALLASGAQPVVAQRAAAATSRVSSPISARASAGAAADDSIGDFGALIARLSETGGYFDTDNLISNERSYLHVLGALDHYGVHGGAYIGVGPDQNFSYIARIRPAIAFIIDIRRDNLLQHLMFKALFANASNRVEYLALWLGKRAPANSATWTDKPIDAIVTYLDSTPTTAETSASARLLVLADVRQYGVPLTPADLATIERFHATFISAGLSLRFTSAGRRPQPYYPTLRQLILERDMEGHEASYLARETDFRFVKELERRNHVVPVVGDLGGTKALPAIGAYLTRRGDRLSALYASNAEDYVMRDDHFATYATSVAALPHDAHSVIIRSYFGGGQHPENVPGYYSTQLLQKVDAFVAGVKGAGYSSYRDLVRRDYLPLHAR